MKFNTALKFLVAFEALRVMYVRFGVRAKSVVVDRTSENNGDSVGRFSPNGINNLHVVVDPVTRDMHHTVADAAASDVVLVLETIPFDSVGRFSPNGINNLRVVGDPVSGDGSSSKTGTMHHTVADAVVSDVLLDTLPADSGGQFSPNRINNLRVVGDPVSGDGSSSKTGTMHHTVADAVVSDVLLDTLPADSGGQFSPNRINNLRVVGDPVSGDGSSSKTGTMHHTVADAVVSDVLLETLPADSGGHFSPSGINNLRVVVYPVTRGDISSTTTGTMHHTVADGAASDFKLVTGSSSMTGTMHHTVASDVLLETLSVDSGGRFSSNGMDALASDDLQQSKQDISAVISDVSIIFDAMNDDDGISSFTNTDGDAFSTQRKLSKSSKKVKHPEDLCTLSLFADSVFMYGNQCFDDIMVTISLCDDKDDTCYISERLPSLTQEEEENQEEEQCFVGGSFPAKQNILYNPLTGDREFLYLDLTDDSCNMYTDDDGTGSLGLKARINVKTNPDVMFIQFSRDKGFTFYNVGDERVAERSTTHSDRFLRQDGEMKPVLSMDPHPFASHHRRRLSDCENDLFGIFLSLRHPKANGLVNFSLDRQEQDFIEKFTRSPKKCGRCYGAWPVHCEIRDCFLYDTLCCNTCTEVEDAYANVGWELFIGEDDSPPDYADIVQCYDYHATKHPECAKLQNDDGWYGRSNCMHNRFGWGWDFNVQTCYKFKGSDQHCWSNSVQINTYRLGKKLRPHHEYTFDDYDEYATAECFPKGTTTINTFTFGKKVTREESDWECVPNGDYASCGPRCLEFV